MKYFDLHCDTATCLFDDGETFENTDCVVNSRSAETFEKYCQTFAFWFNDVTHARGFEYLKNALEYFRKIVSEISAEPVLSVEGGGCLEGDLDRIFWLKSEGFRIFGLSWNGENELASGNVLSPKKGLTPLGKEAVGLLDETGIVPDISHLSDAGAYDVFSYAKGKVVATHSCARRVFDHPRNITDEMITEIISRGGLIGLNLYPKALSENPKAEDLLFHAEHILSLGGENALAFGCDWDGTELPDGITGLASLSSLREKFVSAFSEEIAEKVFYNNAAAFFDKE